MSSDGPAPRKRLRFPRPPGHEAHRARRVVVGLGSNRTPRSTSRRARAHAHVRPAREVHALRGPARGRAGGRPARGGLGHRVLEHRRARPHRGLLRRASRHPARHRGGPGRDRSTPAIVAIDIDILLIEDEVVRTPEDRPRPSPGPLRQAPRGDPRRRGRAVTPPSADRRTPLRGRRAARLRRQSIQPPATSTFWPTR